MGKKGYQAAMERLSRTDATEYAWLWRKVRSYFRARGTWFGSDRCHDDEGESPTASC